jgi:histidyl-tRNA synthetase
MSKNTAKKTTDKPANSQPQLQTVKGFRDIIGDEYYRYQGFFEKAQEIASYYGFSPLEVPMVEFTSTYERGVGEETDVVKKELYRLTTAGGDKISLRPEFTAGVMRSYIENGWQSLPQPIMVYNYGPVFRHDRPQKGRYREFKQFNLEILGSEKSILDALIIKTTVMILQQAGLKDLVVEINSIGDKESRGRFIKELASYYKKLANKLCDNCKERVKTSPLKLLDCKSEQCKPFKDNAPKSINCLNTDTKKHFKEVLEYLEGSGVTYNINHTLVRGLDYYTHTVFEIESIMTDDDGIQKRLSVAGGGRYDYLAKAMGHKKDVSAVGVALGVDRILLMPGTEDIQAKIQKKPKVFFIQLGLEAKLHSIEVIEHLREAKIPIAQSISKDSLGIQLGMAERLGVPYVIIYGQKESLNKTVIVKNMKTHTQETIKIENVVEYFKKKA